MTTQQECHACWPRTGFNHNTWGFNHQQEGIQVRNPRIEPENSFLFEYVWMRTAMEHMENNMKTLVCFLLNKATKPWRNPPSMARPLSNWSLWVCRVLQRMFGPLAAWRSLWVLHGPFPSHDSWRHILQFLWTNIEFAGIHHPPFLDKPKMDPSTRFSLLDCLDLWSLRHSLVLSAVGQLAVRTLQRRGSFVHKATSTWCQQNGWRGGTHGKPLGNSLFQVDCHIGWFRVEKLHFGQLG